MPDRLRAGGAAGEFSHGLRLDQGNYRLLVPLRSERSEGKCQLRVHIFNGALDVRSRPAGVLNPAGTPAAVVAAVVVAETAVPAVRHNSESQREAWNEHRGAGLPEGVVQSHGSGDAQDQTQAQRTQESQRRRHHVDHLPREVGDAGADPGYAAGELHEQCAQPERDPS